MSAKSQEPRSIAVDPIWVKVEDVCHLCSVSRATVYRKLAKREIAAVKSGRRLLVRYASVRAHFDSLPTALFRGGAAE